MNGSEARPGDSRVKQGVVAIVVHAGRFLMIRRAPGILAEGAWCFVGGGIEPGESQPDAVVREFAEEVGAKVQPVRKIWEFRRSDGLLLLHWWLADFQQQPLTPNAAEVSEIRWCTPTQILELPDILGSNTAFLESPAFQEALESNDGGGEGTRTRE